MKVAVQLFGHMRTFEQCSGSLKEKLLDIIDCDVFIHTWDSIDSNLEISDTLRDWHEEIIEAYNPRKLKMETQEAFDKTVIYNEHHCFPGNVYNVPLYGLKNMLISMSSVTKLRQEYEKETKVAYDYVIMLRPDILLGEDFSLEKYLKYFLFNNSYLISFSDHPRFYLADDCYELVYPACDIFFFSTSDVIDSCFSDLNFFNDCYITYPKFFPKYMHMPERSFQEYVNRKGGEIKYMRYKFSIIRKNSSDNIHLNQEVMSDIPHKSVLMYRKAEKYRKISFILLGMLLAVIIQAVLF